MLRAGASGDRAGVCEPRRGQTQSVDTHFNKNDEDQAARRGLGVFMEATASMSCRDGVGPAQAR